MDPRLVPGVPDRDAQHDALASVIASLESDLGLLSMVDVVWNHSACNSPWLA